MTDGFALTPCLVISTPVFCVSPPTTSELQRKAPVITSKTHKGKGKGSGDVFAYTFFYVRWFNVDFSHQFAAIGKLLVNIHRIIQILKHGICWESFTEEAPQPTQHLISTKTSLFKAFALRNWAGMPAYSWLVHLLPAPNLPPRLDYAHSLLTFGFP